MASPTSSIPLDKSGGVSRDSISAPIAGSTKLFQGTLCMYDAGGDLVELTAGGRYAGCLPEGTVDNTGGSDGDATGNLWGKALVHGVPVTGGAGKPSVGADVYASGPNPATDLTLTGAGNTRVGKVIGYDGSAYSVCLVADQWREAAKGLQIAAKTADFAVEEYDAGRVFTTVGAGGTVVASLPPAVAGMGPFTFVVGAAQELRLDPDGTETIALPSTGAQSAAGKYITANAAGESVVIACTTTGAWTVLGYIGTWTAEA